MPRLTTPDDFDPIFKQGVLIVGGHAVNLWGSYYAHRGDPELQQFAPFISKDGDVFLSDKALARALASAAGWQFRDNPEVRSSMLGHIYLVNDEEELRIDVLRTVNGLTNEDLAATEELHFADGRTYLLPAPEMMLKAKLGNLATIQQEDRQDARHARIMVACCRNYLTDIYRACLSDYISERDAIDRFTSTFRVVQAEIAKAMDVRFDLGLSSTIPARVNFAEINRLPRLLAFYDHQVGAKQGPRLSI